MQSDIKFKLCSGATHKEPALLPIENFWRDRKRNVLRSQCKFCETIRRGAEPMVPVDRMRPFVQELVNRVGVCEAARRLDMTGNGLYLIRHGRTRKMKRKTARKLIAVLHEIREENLVRHRDSIHHGAYLRGREERKVTSFRHLYKPKGDGDVRINKIGRKRSAMS